ncbi:uncharacterized, partial [Tachysurus ichikawai]
LSSQFFYSLTVGSVGDSEICRRKDDGGLNLFSPQAAASDGELRDENKQGGGKGSGR